MNPKNTGLNAMEIKQVTVLGAGLMGHGIAQICAQAGKYEVVMHDLDSRLISNGMTMIETSLKRFVKKAVISETESKETVSRIHTSVDLNEAVQHADLVIEAITENLGIKTSVLAKVGKSAPPHTLVASNTSSISITEIGAATGRPEKVCGMHFFNPPQLMKLVEVIRGLRTSDDTVETVRQVSIRLGKEPIVVKKDTPAFVVNRIVTPALNEAVYLLAEGIADASDIDKACELGLNWPMGPLKLLDYIGIDTHLSVSQVLANETGDPKFRPSVLLKQMVRANLLGRKTGQGFYSWPEK